MSSVINGETLAELPPEPIKPKTIFVTGNFPIGEVMTRSEATVFALGYTPMIISSPDNPRRRTFLIETISKEQDPRHFERDINLSIRHANTQTPEISADGSVNEDTTPTYSIELFPEYKGEHLENDTQRHRQLLEDLGHIMGELEVALVKQFAD